jgi:flagellin-specific chaperone FliS
MQTQYESYTPIILDRLESIKFSSISLKGPKRFFRLFPSSTKFPISKLVSDSKTSNEFLDAKELTKLMVERAKNEEKNSAMDSAQEKVLEILKDYSASIKMAVDSLTSDVMLELFPKSLASNFIEDLADGALNEDGEFERKLEELLNYMGRRRSNNDIKENIKKVDNFEKAMQECLKNSIETINKIKNVNVHPTPTQCKVKAIKQNAWGGKGTSIAHGMDFLSGNAGYVLANDAGEFQISNIKDDTLIAKDNFSNSKPVVIPCCLRVSPSGKLLATTDPSKACFNLFDLSTVKKKEKDGLATKKTMVYMGSFTVFDWIDNDWVLVGTENGSLFSKKLGKNKEDKELIFPEIRQTRKFHA